MSTTRVDCEPPSSVRCADPAALFERGRLGLGITLVPLAPPPPPYSTHAARWETLAAEIDAAESDVQRALAFVVAAIGRDVKDHVVSTAHRILDLAQDDVSFLEIYVGRTAVPPLASLPFSPSNLATWSFSTSYGGPATRWKVTYKPEGYHGMVVALVITPAVAGVVLPPDKLAALPRRDVAEGGAAHTLSLLVEQATIAAFDVAPPSEHPRVRKALRNVAERGNTRGGADAAAHCVYFAYRFVSAEELPPLQLPPTTPRRWGPRTPRHRPALDTDPDAPLPFTSGASTVRFIDPDALFRRGPLGGGVAHVQLALDWTAMGAANCATPDLDARQAIRSAVLDIAVRLKGHIVATAERALQCAAYLDDGCYAEVCVGRTCVPPMPSSEFNPLDISTWSFGGGGGPASRWKVLYKPSLFHGLVVVLVITPRDAGALGVLDARGLASLSGRETADCGAAHTLSLLVEQAVIGLFAAAPHDAHPRVRKVSSNVLERGNPRGSQDVHCVYFAYRMVRADHDPSVLPAAEAAAAAATEAEASAAVVAAAEVPAEVVAEAPAAVVTQPAAAPATVAAAPAAAPLPPPTLERAAVEPSPAGGCYADGEIGIGGAAEAVDVEVEYLSEDEDIYELSEAHRAVDTAAARVAVARASLLAAEEELQAARARLGALWR